MTPVHPLEFDSPAPAFSAIQPWPGDLSIRKTRFLLWKSRPASQERVSLLVSGADCTVPLIFDIIRECLRCPIWATLHASGLRGTCLLGMFLMGVLGAWTPDVHFNRESQIRRFSRLSFAGFRASFALKLGLFAVCRCYISYVTFSRQILIRARPL